MKQYRQPANSRIEDTSQQETSTSSGPGNAFLNEQLQALGASAPAPDVVDATNEQLTMIEEAVLGA